MLGREQAWHLAGYESTPEDARICTLNEGLMGTLTQEERDAMKDDDKATESVDSSEQPFEQATSDEVAGTGLAPEAGKAGLVDTNSEQASDTEQSTQ